MPNISLWSPAPDHSKENAGLLVGLSAFVYLPEPLHMGTQNHIFVSLPGVCCNNIFAA